MFPTFYFDTNTSTMKSGNDARIQTMTTIMIIGYCAHTLVVAYPEHLIPLGLFIGSVTCCSAIVYGIYTRENSLALTRDVFKNMDTNDVLKSIQGAISSLENTEGIVRSSRSDPEETFKILKLFHNGNLWEKLISQQMREIFVLTKLFISEEKFDFNNETDLELISCSKILDSASGGKDISYLDKLNNFDKIFNVINNKDYNLKALAAAFIMQIYFRSIVSNEKKYEKVIVKEKIPEIIINDIPVVQQNPQNPVENKIVLFGSNASKELQRAEGIPENVNYDRDSFCDIEFIRKDYPKQCVWLRAKDIQPRNNETMLIEDECEGSIEYFLCIFYHVKGKEIWMIAGLLLQLWLLRLKLRILSGNYLLQKNTSLAANTRLCSHLILKTKSSNSTTISLA